MAILRTSVTERFKDLLGRRLFLDREPGVLLVWVEADKHDVASLVPHVEALHPGTRFAVQTSGAAVAVRMTARDDELAAIEHLYVGHPIAGRPGRPPLFGSESVRIG